MPSVRVSRGCDRTSTVCTQLRPTHSPANLRNIERIQMLCRVCTAESARSSERQSLPVRRPPIQVLPILPAPIPRFQLNKSSEMSFFDRFFLPEVACLRLVSCFCALFTISQPAQSSLTLQRDVNTRFESLIETHSSGKAAASFIIC